jgi:hypothetical protein
MANALTSNPLIIDTDITSYRTAANQLQGVRVSKIMLVSGSGGSIAGSVAITAPSDSSVLYPVIPSAVGAAGTILYSDNVDDNALLTWRDFAVTGATAAGVRLFLWVKV